MVTAANTRVLEYNRELTGSGKVEIVPEPSTLLLAGLGLTAVGLWRRRRKK